MAGSITESRLKEIKKIVGSPADGGAVEYNKRLKAETDKDNSLDQYLRWSLAKLAPKRPPQYNPKQILDRLSTTDYKDMESLMNFRSDLSFCISTNIELSKSKDEAFVVAADPETVAPLYEPPDTVPPIEQQVGDFPFHPGFLTATVAKKNDKDTPAPTVQLPTLVLPIGRLLRKDTRPVGTLGDTSLDKSVGKRDFEETNYVVVVDALRPEHSVWLVYNRNVLNQDTGDRDEVDPSQQPVVFDSLRTNFDAAQIFATSKSWKDGSTDLERLKGLIQNTMITGAVSFGGAKMDDVSKAFNDARPSPAQSG